MTFSSKFSSSCSHILEVVLSQTVVQTLSIVLEKIMATVVTIIRNFMEESTHGFPILTKVSTILYFLVYNIIGS